MKSLLKKLWVVGFLFSTILFPVKGYSWCPQNLFGVDCDVGTDGPGDPPSPQVVYPVLFCVVQKDYLTSLPACTAAINTCLSFSQNCVSNICGKVSAVDFGADKNHAELKYSSATCSSGVQEGNAVNSCSLLVSQIQIDQTCSPANNSICGDGKVTGDEACDGNQAKNGLLLPPSKCSSDCKVISTCGDGQVTGDEACDGNLDKGGAPLPQGITCSSDCMTKIAPFPTEDLCGNGKLDAGEVCDGKIFKDPNAPAGSICSKDCKNFYSSAPLPPVPQTPIGVDPSPFQNPPVGENPGDAGGEVGSQGPPKTCVIHGKLGYSCPMSCSFIPGGEGGGSMIPWFVFALGLTPILGRRYKM
jgi:hypothetical protein